MSKALEAMIEMSTGVIDTTVIDSIRTSSILRALE